MRDTRFQLVDEIRKWLDDFSVSKDVKLFRAEIRRLPEKWLNVIWKATANIRLVFERTSNVAETI